MTEIALGDRIRASDTSDAAVLAARVGYVAKGFLYCVVAVLAILVAAGRGGRLTDSKGALEELHQTVPGDVVVLLAAVGLACYALWSFVRAIMDPEHTVAKSRGLTRLCVRFGYGVVGLLHGVLAYYAVALVVDGDHGRDSTAKSVGRVMHLPFGRVLVAGVGVAVLGIGLSQLYRGVFNRLGREYRASGLDQAPHRAALRVARAGVTARGLVFVLIGASFLTAAQRARAAEARGVGETLHDLIGQPFGRVLLGVVALGLLGYGLAQWFIARYGDLPRPG